MTFAYLILSYKNHGQLLRVDWNAGDPGDSYAYCWNGALYYV
jgi:hypothetical protein